MKNYSEGDKFYAYNNATNEPAEIGYIWEVVTRKDRILYVLCLITKDGSDCGFVVCVDGKQKGSIETCYPCGSTYWFKRNIEAKAQAERLKIYISQELKRLDGLECYKPDVVEDVKEDITDIIEMMEVLT